MGKERAWCIGHRAWRIGHRAEGLEFEIRNEVKSSWREDGRLKAESSK